MFAPTLWTEEEASQKWCPMGRAEPMSNATSQGAQPQTNRHFLCIASNCMMWRKHDQIGIGPNGEKRDRDMDGRTRWTDRGYCGLAGNPTAPKSAV